MKFSLSLLYAVSLNFQIFCHRPVAFLHNCNHVFHRNVDLLFCSAFVNTFVGARSLVRVAQSQKALEEEEEGEKGTHRQFARAACDWNEHSISVSTLAGSDQEETASMFNEQSEKG